jgi:hypothetical protein
MRAIGYPLYVNGHLYQEPVTISHVPGAQAQGVLRGLGVDPSMGSLVSYQITPGLGADAEPPPIPPLPDRPLLSPAVRVAWEVGALASTMALAYHGYKRNESIGWAIGWALLGGAFPIIGWPVALAQGFGKRKGMTPNRRRSHTKNPRWYKIKVIPPAWVGRPGSEKQATFTWSQDPSWAHEFAMKQKHRGAKVLITPTDEKPPFKKNRRRARRRRRR